MHAAHGHHHHDDGHTHYDRSAADDRRYTIAIALNLGFVAIETAAGFLANSTALLSDAAHNLSDVLGLAFAGGAAWLASRQTSERRTYGYAKATVLAALANALVLVLACSGILWEAIGRLLRPEPAQAGIVMAVAAAGVLINGATALLFARQRRHDVNARGAYLHMLADAGVSAAVIAAGAAMLLTRWTWIDPAISLVVVAVILWSTWGLLQESLDLALDAAPAHIDVGALRAFLAAQPGVTAVHDLHVWALSATKPALTAHIVRPDGNDDAFLAELTEALTKKFGISHVTVQVERTRRDDCAEC
jgi:cobalt-zinc-cadmium efflux system protein